MTEKQETAKNGNSTGCDVVKKRNRSSKNPISVILKLINPQTISASKKFNYRHSLMPKTKRSVTGITTAETVESHERNDRQACNVITAAEEPRVCDGKVG